MKKRLPWVVLCILSLACQWVPAPPPLRTPARPTLSSGKSTQSAPSSDGHTQVLPSATAFATSTPVPPPRALAPFPPSRLFSDVNLFIWEPPQAALAWEHPPESLDEVINAQVASGLTYTQQAFLLQNGFVIIRSQEPGFQSIRQRVSLINGQPFFLTVDHAYYAIHLALLDIRMQLEGQVLRPRLLELLQACMGEMLALLTSAEGTALEEDILLGAAYLGVGVKLIDSQSELPPVLRLLVEHQISQIVEAQPGMAQSSLIPGYRDDFSQYRPSGHYAAGSELEGYYRALVWLQRAGFALQEGELSTQMSRVPLLLTLALRRARTPQGSAAEEWALLDDTYTFIAGQSADSGPRQYAVWMDRVYGFAPGLLDLEDDTRLRTFLDLSQGVPLSAGLPAWMFLTARREDATAWRFIGRRPPLEDYVFPYLRQVTGFSLPSGMHLMASLGSQEALRWLQENQLEGETADLDSLFALRDELAAIPRDTWLSSQPALIWDILRDTMQPKEAYYAPFMLTDAWRGKELLSALGFWVLQHHDEPFGGYQVETPQPSGEYTSPPPPAYVEPQPQIFYHLAYLANSLVEGISSRYGILASSTEDDPMTNALLQLQDLGDRMLRLGDIAAKELRGEQLDSRDYALLQAPLGAVENASLEALLRGEARENYPAIPFLTSLSHSADMTLQVGLGWVDRLYVLLPLEGAWVLAQGGVFSYGRHSAPHGQVLSESDWRMMSRDAESEIFPILEGGAFAGGAPRDVLFFRVGDIYSITSQGENLNLRAEPDRNAPLVHQLAAGDYVIILDGPMEMDGFTWWKFRLLNVEEDILGWAVENADWYIRAWGQE